MLMATGPVKVLGFSGSLRGLVQLRGAARGASTRSRCTHHRALRYLSGPALQRGRSPEGLSAAGRGSPQEDQGGRRALALRRNTTTRSQVCSRTRSTGRRAARATVRRQADRAEREPFHPAASSAYHLRQIFVYLNPHPEPAGGDDLGGVKFDASGKLTDEPTRKQLRDLLANLKTLTERLRG